MNAPALDHLVYVVPHLDHAIEELAQRLGVRPAHGGSHPGTGTCNALLSLGSNAYLEVIGPDPAQPAVARRSFGIDAQMPPRLLTWAVRPSDLDAAVERARAAGYDPGAISSGSRKRPDATVLNWRSTFRPDAAGDGLVPFLIDWGSSRHPSETAPHGCRFLSLRAEHPEAETIHSMLDAVGVSLPLAAGPAPALIAVLDTSAGEVELG